MAKLSFLIPARNEEWLARTIASILASIRGDSEIVVALDGAWADPPIQDDRRVRLIYFPTAIGQRAATNLAARVATGRYLCKIDAHCAVAEGFDVAMMTAGDECGPQTTLIPAMLNLHAFNWACRACGKESYQGPTPTACQNCQVTGPFERVVYWDLNAGGVPGKPMRTEFWRFDYDLHFQYHGPVRKDQRHAEIADVMSSVGACFVMRRDRFVALGGLDESHGSWGQFGTELACKSWLSGGRHVVCRGRACETCGGKGMSTAQDGRPLMMCAACSGAGSPGPWFAHLFRTQGGDFSFPYPMRGSDQERARQHSRQLWLENAWPGQVRPLSWLVDYFEPIRGWHTPDGPQETPEIRKLRVARLDAVRKAGASFKLRPRRRAQHVDAVHGKHEASTDVPPSPAVVEAHSCGLRSDDADRSATDCPDGRKAGVTKGLLYYSDCRGDPRILAAVRDQITRAAAGLPLVSVTLAPLDFGQNIVLEAQRGPETMFWQILAGLEALQTDVVFFVEHDVLYSAEHFRFEPPRRDAFFYNENRWQVCVETGRAVHYRCCQTAQLCAARLLLVEHYRRRIAAVEAAGGYRRYMGYEPGTNRWAHSIDPHGFETWWAPVPNIDIRHGQNLSKTRWDPSLFRNKNSCLGWIEADTVFGWGTTKGRFWEFLGDATGKRDDSRL